MQIIKYLFFLLAVCPCQGYRATAQNDTIRVMAYNVLAYGEYPLCQGPDSFYNGYLQTIVQFANPDIIGLEKMGSIQTSLSDHNYSAAIGFQDSILQYALNTAYPGRYNYCPFTNNAASTTECLVFYDQQKLGFVALTCTYTNTEDFNTYKLYYKDPNLATTHDTTYLYVTDNHDISGNGNEAQRGAQIAGEMTQISSHFTHLANMINMGDFNVRYSSEPCYQTLTAPADTNFRYYDPPFHPDAAFSYPANWDANPNTFTSCLTTSTRALGNVPNSCGTNGGAKDWYDHIFLSPWIINNENYISYIPHSFRVIGNDGRRLSISVNDAPTNTSAPSNVINALFQMSNKYPVMVDLLATSNTTGISLPDPEITPAAVVAQKLIEEHVAVVNPIGSALTLHLSNNLLTHTLYIDCVDMLGRSQIHQTILVNTETEQISCNLLPGIYCIIITDDQKIINRSVVAKY